MRIAQWLELISGLAAAAVGVFTARGLIWDLWTRNLAPAIIGLIVAGLLAWVVGVLSAVVHSQTRKTFWKVSLWICTAFLLCATAFTAYPPISVGYLAALALLVATASSFVASDSEVPSTR